MFCPRCGKELSDGTAFCAYCGVSLDVGSSNDDENEERSHTDDSSSPAEEEPKEQEPVEPETAEGNQQSGFVRSMPFRIILLVMVVALVAVGIVRVSQGAGVIGISPVRQEPQRQQGDQQQAAEKPEEKQAEASNKVDESRAQTSKGLITLYGCAELDGSQLSKIIKEHEYEQISNESSTFMSPDTKGYGLFVSTDVKKENVGIEDVEKLEVGGEGTPVMYNIVVAGYETTSDAFEEVGNLQLEKSATTSNGMDVGIYKNVAGRRFLYAGHVNDNKSVGLLLYNEDALSAGYLPKLGTTIDEVYASLTSSDVKKDGEGANEVSFDDIQSANIE